MRSSGVQIKPQMLLAAEKLAQTFSLCSKINCLSVFETTGSGPVSGRLGFCVAAAMLK